MKVHPYIAKTGGAIYVFLALFCLETVKYIHVHTCSSLRLAIRGTINMACIRTNQLAWKQAIACVYGGLSVLGCHGAIQLYAFCAYMLYIQLFVYTLVFRSTEEETLPQTPQWATPDNLSATVKTEAGTCEWVCVCVCVCVCVSFLCLWIWCQRGHTSRTFCSTMSQIFWLHSRMLLLDGGAHCIVCLLQICVPPDSYPPSRYDLYTCTVIREIFDLD